MIITTYYWFAIVSIAVNVFELLNVEEYRVGDYLHGSLKVIENRTVRKLR